MMTKYFWSALLCAAIALLVAVAGCATTASVTTLQPIEAPLTQYKKALVVVTSSPEVRWRDEKSSVEARLKFALMDKLRAAKKFQSVTDEAPAQPAASDLKILLTISSLGSARSGGWTPSIGIGVGGVFSGGSVGVGVDSPVGGSSGGMSVQVDLLDAQSGRRLGYLDAAATSGDFAAQAEAIAEKVAAEIAAK
jgi:hypothetical protein